MHFAVFRCKHGGQGSQKHELQSGHFDPHSAQEKTPFSFGIENLNHKLYG